MNGMKVNKEAVREARKPLQNGVVLVHAGETLTVGQLYARLEHIIANQAKRGDPEVQEK